MDSTHSSRQHLRAEKVANIIGSFGYLSIIIQWFWALATIVLPYMQHSSLESLFVPSDSHAHTVSGAGIVELPQSVQIAAMIVAVLFTIAVIIYAIYAIPRSVGRLGKNITQKSATVTVQHMTHHRRPLTVVEKKRVYEYLTWGIKTLLIILPFGLTLLPTHTSLTIPHDALLAISMVTLGASVFWFGLQYLIVALFRINSKSVW